MKNNLSIHAIKKPNAHSLVIKEILKPDIVVESGIKELDEITGGFKAEKLTFVDGDSELISNLPNQICVNTYRTFHGDTIYIDGGMRADPYRIAQYARKMELNQEELLEHIRISRAFTVYQLTTLIQDMLEPIIKRYTPKTLIIERFPSLYLDSDISSKEAQTLLKNNLAKIRELTSEYSLITIFTNLDKRMLSNRRNVRKILYSDIDEIVLMKQMELFTRVELVKRQISTTILSLANAQLQLQEFGMVI